MREPAAPGADLLRLWAGLHRLPGGGALFSFLLGRRIPYTGTIGARVVELERGHARIRMRDRRKVRNHLRSIHAVALVNLGEFAGGLATLTGLPAGYRGIVLKLEATYMKKARGELSAEARWQAPEGLEDIDDEGLDHWVEGHVTDLSGDRVATVRALWRLGKVR